MRISHIPFSIEFREVNMIFKKIFNLFVFKQTLDNNESWENQLENEVLTEDFNMRVRHFNKVNTYHLIDKYLFKKHPEILGSLRDDERAEAIELFAQKLFKNNMMDSNFIIIPQIIKCLEGEK